MEYVTRSEKLRSLAVVDTTVYVAGTFMMLDWASRFDLGALSAITGHATPWNPRPERPTTSLVVHDATLFVGGDFFAIDGRARRGLAQFDLATGRLTEWDPGADGAVDALIEQNGWLYAGGSFTSIGGSPHLNLAALDPSTGETADWSPELDGSRVTVETITVGPQGVYVGGTFLSMNGAPQAYLAATSPVMDILTPVVIVQGLAEILDRGVRLVWSDLPERSTVIVYRRTKSSSWQALRRLTVDHSRRLVYEDFDVFGSSRYGYRLGILGGTNEEFAGETWVDVPGTSSSGLIASNPHRMGAALRVSFDLTDDRPTALEVLDISGRIVLREDVGFMGRGAHHVTLAGSERLRPELYFLRLSRSGGALVRRLVVTE